MARPGKVVATPYNSTRGETAIQEFANSNLTPELLRQRAATLLDSKELLRDVRGLTPEDQAKFLDRVDQVCRGDPLFFLEIIPPLILQRHIRLSTRKMRNL